MKSIKKPGYPRKLSKTEIADKLIKDILQEERRALAQAMANPIRGATPSPFVLIEPDDEESKGD